MSVYALSDDFWRYSEEADRRFRRLVTLFGIPLLIFSLILPFLQVSGLQEGGGQLGNSRTAELLFEEELPVAEEPEEPAPVDEPDEITEEAKPEPVPVEQPKEKVVVETPPDNTAKNAELAQQQAREVAQQSGVLAFADSLKDLRDSTLTGMDAAQPLTSGVVGTSGGSSAGGSSSSGAAAIAASARSSSGGIGQAEVKRSQGGTGIGERKTTTVAKPAGFGETPKKIGQGGDKRSAGRTLEEIQLVFDRNKGSIYTIYNRALRDNPGLQGKVLLNLTISASGAVTACEVVSSELDDPDLERKLVARVRLLNFGAKNVDSMTLDYPIYFLPS